MQTSSFEVTGGRTLNGSIAPKGAKNEALQVICTPLLTTEKVTISNIPDIADDAGWAALLAQKATEMTALNNAMGQSAQILSAIETERLSAIAQLIAQNNVISPVSIQEDNERTVNAIFLETFAQNNPQFTAEQSSLLKSIAVQCPLDGGNAVIASRVMLEWEEETSYDDNELCQAGGGERSSAGSSNNNTPNDFIRLFPNPANTYLLIETPSESELSGLAIVNSVGTEVLRLEAEDSSHFQALLDISQLPQGVYACRFLTNNKAVPSKKFIIVR